MGYCTTAQVRSLVDGTPNLRMPSEADCASYIALAQQWVDPNLRGLGLEVPYADGEVPDMVQLLAATRAAEILVRRHNDQGQFDALVSSLMSDRREMLKDLRSGNARLDLNDADAEAAMIDVYETVNPHGKPVMDYDTRGRRKK